VLEDIEKLCAAENGRQTQLVATGEHNTVASLEPFYILGYGYIFAVAYAHVTYIVAAQFLKSADIVFCHLVGDRRRSSDHFYPGLAGDDTDDVSKYAQFEEIEPVSLHDTLLKVCSFIFRAAYSY
jgi:hypothetical protein